jgi:hypothetical protein
MRVLDIQCRSCGAGFVESRRSLVPGDEAVCPACGARHAYRREYIEALQADESGGIPDPHHAAHPFDDVPD